jgi:hypothetical protein
MVPPNFKDSYGKITLASNHLLNQRPVSFNSNLNLRKISALISNSLHFINLKVSVKNPMVFLDFLLIKRWARRSFITFFLSKIMESLITLWSVSVLHPRKWVRLHTLSSVDTTPPKLLVVLPVLNLSRTSQIGLEHGLLKDKECTMVLNQCKNQVKTQLIQLSLILEALNFPFHQMCLTRSKPNGKKLFQHLIAHPTKLSATLLKVVTQLLQRLSQLVSK